MLETRYSIEHNTDGGHTATYEVS